VRRVVCPGSFDPVTNGHLDVISRTAVLHDEVVVAVFRNSNKTPLFTIDERVELLTQATSKIGNVRIDRFDGLIVDYCKANDITAIVKGLRAVTDFDYEMQMAQMNYNQAGVETLFVITNPLYAFLSSSLVKDFAKFGGDVSGLVPAVVLDRLAARLAETP
jgi:pantetheine-phosphate adenylyltransferase